MLIFWWKFVTDQRLFNYFPRCWLCKLHLSETFYLIIEFKFYKWHPARQKNEI